MLLFLVVGPNYDLTLCANYRDQESEACNFQADARVILCLCRYVKEKRKTCCGLPCTDKGRESKTVPYDKITDCDVQDPV